MTRFQGKQWKTSICDDVFLYLPVSNYGRRTNAKAEESHLVFARNLLPNETRPGWMRLRVAAVLERTVEGLSQAFQGLRCGSMVMGNQQAG